MTMTSSPSNLGSTHPRVDNFVLEDKLGSGTYATVYKGYKKNDEKKIPYAIKCISKSSLNEKSVENLLIEIEILKQIKHDHIVQLIDFQWDNSYIFLIMEYCAGGDLSTFIHTRRHLAEYIVRRFLQQIASALQLLHNHNITHMDLKPQNILLTSIENPVLKIADFGFARYIEQNQDYNIRGTPLYMAPEIILKHYYDAKVDLWSVGVILYESLFGKAPFASRTFDELEAKIKSNQPIVIPSTPVISEECRALLVRLLQRNPQDRISFDEFFNDPYVDLEHKPSENCLEKASSIIKQAIEEDKNGKVGDAVKLYMKSIEYFLPAIYYERDRRKKEALRQKVNEYCERAEQLKQLLKPSENLLQFPSLEKLSQLSSDKPAVLEGLKFLTSARSLDDALRYKEALTFYERSLNLLLSASSDETNPLRKNLLRGIIEVSLKRAEEIKGYIQVQEANQITSQKIQEADQESHSKCLLQ